MKQLLILLFIVLTSFSVLSQESMMPPKPINNAVLESSVGEWTGVSEMMGQKFNENMKVYWALGGQYLLWETKSTDQNNNLMYDGLGLFTLNPDGTLKVWWFDNWGAGSMMTGSGSISGNKVELTSSGPAMTDHRTWEVKDGKMIMDWRSVWKEGTNQNEMQGQTVFTKK